MSRDDRNDSDFPLDPYFGPPEPELDPGLDAEFAAAFQRNSVKFSEPPPRIGEHVDPYAEPPPPPEDDPEVFKAQVEVGQEIAKIVAHNSVSYSKPPPEMPVDPPQPKKGFLLDPEGMSDEEVFDALARWIGVDDPEALRKQAKEEGWF
jgi:hypothetical protein